MMKALTVKQPWAWAIIHGGKNVENRSRSTKYRGRLYIHAGKGYAPEALKFPAFRTIDLDFDVTGETERGIDVRGMVIGTVDVIDCHEALECFDGATRTGQYCSPWAEGASPLAKNYHWVLANPRPLACPFPEKGQLGLWNLSSAP